MNVALLKRTLAKVRTALPGAKPSCSLILGSGWNDIVDAFHTKRSVSYRKIPGLAGTRIEGHAGYIRLAELAGIQMLIFQGRHHWYEGNGWEPVAAPVYISLKLGVSVLLLTNAAGSIRKDLRPGSLMLIDDHINAMGHNPLIGARDPVWGPRFADQSAVYDPCLRQLMLKAARKCSINLSSGIYAAVTGPTYETPSETRALRASGADAVGMSTVPEAILANAAGMRVMGLSCITNSAAQHSRIKLNHREVVDIAGKALPAIKTLLTAFLQELALNVSSVHKNSRR